MPVFRVMHIAGFCCLEIYFFVCCMKKTVVVAAVAAGFLLWKLLKKAQSVRDYAVFIKSFPKIAIKNGALIVDVALSINNKSSETLSLEKASGKVYVRGGLVGAFETSFFGDVVKANDVTDVPVSIVAPVGGVFTALLDVVRMGGKGVPVRVVGSVSMYRFSIPFDLEILANES